MATLLRFSMTLAIALTAHHTLQRIDPNYQRNLIPGVCAVPKLTSDLGRGVLQYRDLTSRSQAMLARIQEKRNLALEVVAGNVNLLDAAAHFQYLDRDMPEAHRERFRSRYQARTDAERYCLEVVAFALGEAKAPGQYRQWERQLQAELDCVFASGPLELLSTAS